MSQAESGKIQNKIPLDCELIRSSISHVKLKRLHATMHNKLLTPLIQPAVDLRRYTIFYYKFNGKENDQ